MAVPPFLKLVPDRLRNLGRGVGHLSCFGLEGFLRIRR